MKLPQTATETNQPGAMNIVDDWLVEKVWRDLDGQLPREQVSHVIAEVALEFQDARVKAFVPILIHREALDRLRKWFEAGSLSDGRLPNNQ